MKFNLKRVSKLVAFIAGILFFMAQFPVGTVSAADDPANRPGREWAEDALQASLRGRYDEAVSLAEKVIQLKPENAEDNAKAYFARGLTLYRQGQQQKAVSDLDMAVNFWPGFLDAYVIRGKAKTDLGMYDNAIQDLSMALKLRPDYARVYSDRAIAYYKKGAYGEAIADTTRAIELNAIDADSYYIRGSAYFKKGDYDRAIGDFDLAIKIEPKKASYYFDRGMALKEMGRTEEGLKDVQKAVEMNPKAERFKKGLAEFDQNNSAKQSLLPEPRSFREKETAAPADITAREQSALKAAQENGTPENRARLAAVRHDHAFMVLDHPRKAPSKKELEEAVAYARSATVLEPENAAHWFLTGLLFRELAEKDKRAAVMAEQALRRAVEIDPEYAAGWLELGLMMVEQERGREAMTALEKALENDPARTALVATGPLCAMYALNDEGFRGVNFFQELYAGNPEVSALGVGSAIMLDHLGDRAAAIGQARDIMVIEAAGTPEHNYAAKLVNEWEGTKP